MDAIIKKTRFGYPQCPLISPSAPCKASLCVAWRAIDEASGLCALMPDALEEIQVRRRHDDMLKGAV